MSEEISTPRGVKMELLQAFIGEWNELVEEGKAPTEALTLEDFTGNPYQPWFHRQAYNVALVDFSTFVPGVGVMLKDTTMAGGFAIQEAAAKRKTGALTEELAAEYVRNHFDRFVVVEDGAEGVTFRELEAGDTDWPKVFKSDPPKPAASPADWRKWVAALGEKEATRLVHGVISFRTMAADSGN